MMVLFCGRGPRVCRYGAWPLWLGRSLRNATEKTIITTDPGYVLVAKLKFFGLEGGFEKYNFAVLSRKIGMLP